MTVDRAGCHEARECTRCMDNPSVRGERHGGPQDIPHEHA